MRLMPMFNSTHTHHHVHYHDDLTEVKRTLQKIVLTQERIMSAISDFAAKQNSHNARIDGAVTGLQRDIAGLNEKIEALQNSAGQITAEDQALLDDIESRSAAIATKLEALDGLTPPTPPVG